MLRCLGAGLSGGRHVERKRKEGPTPTGVSGAVVTVCIMVVVWDKGCSLCCCLGRIADCERPWLGLIWVVHHIRCMVS